MTMKDWNLFKAKLPLTKVLAFVTAVFISFWCHFVCVAVSSKHILLYEHSGSVAFFQGSPHNERLSFLVHHLRETVVFLVPGVPVPYIPMFKSCG